jgi:hypothetical protein
MTKLEEWKMRAIHEFSAKATVPLLYQQGDTLGLLGSASPFSIASRHFLVTAQHLFDGHQFDFKHVAMLYGFSAREAFTLGNFRVVKPSVENVDFGIIELLDEETIAQVASLWQFLTLDSISLDSSARHVAVTGYPEQKFVASTSRLSVVPVTLFTEKLPNAPANLLDPPQPGLDLYYAHEEEAYLLGTGRSKVPGMKGMSGASIWAYREQEAKLWHPSKILKTIGVQSAYVPGKYIRGKSWLAVAQGFYKIDHDLARAITQATGFSPPRDVAS